MSDPVTNVQIEDVLSSIRRLVSEEIGQQEPLKSRADRKKDQEDEKLVLSPAQKIREDAAEKGSDLWEETEELAQKEAAPVWWHRDMSQMASLEEEEPMRLGSPEVEDSDSTPTEEVAEADAPEPKALDGALAGLEAAKDIHDDEWEPPEGEEDLDGGPDFKAMPWQGDEDSDEYDASEESEVIADLSAQEEEPEDEAAADEPEDIPFTFTPGERLFERLSSKKMSAAPIPEVETVEASVAEEAFEPAEDTSSLDFNDEDYFSGSLETADESDIPNIFDEDMLRDMVTDIIRQELQGVLGERITRNVRKLVRREIQRALSDLNN